MPHQALGTRIEPPWSPPMATSQSPAATRAPLPLEDPPAIREWSWGLRTGPVWLVWLPPEKQRSSHTALPTISPPASSMRVTTVASNSGTYPSTAALPFIIGTPATQMLSFMAMRLPTKGPDSAPLIEHLQYQALKGFSSGVGRYPLERGYLTGGG